MSTEEAWLTKPTSKVFCAARAAVADAWKMDESAVLAVREGGDLGGTERYFSRMRSEGSRFIWGSGGEAVFAESCVYVGNRSRGTATVCGSAISSPQWRVRQEWSRKRVKLTRVAAVILVFAEEVSMRVICVAAVILAFAEEVFV